jgi:hypothetical protein
VTVEIAGFAIDREIGRGGFGTVYRATQLAFNRPVAIKVLHAGAPGSDIEKQFANECRALGALRSHPNVLTVYSTGVTSEGAPYMAMELLSGGSLSQRLPVAPGEAAAIGEQLAAGLQVAHDGGVIHCDVKPANVLFDDDDNPVLVDFGISALVGEGTHTGSTDVALSLAFAPPEVLDGARPGVAADIYSLGATLFCAITGRSPFVATDGRNSIALIASRIATQPVEDLRPLGVPAGLCAVIETAMAKDPRARFASMTQLQNALAPLAGERVRHERVVGAAAPLVIADSTTGLRRLATAARRPRNAAVAAAAVVVLAAGGTAWAVHSTSTQGDAADVTSLRAPATTSDGRTVAISGASATTSASGPDAGASGGGDTTRQRVGLTPPRRSASRTVVRTLPGGRVTTTVVAPPPAPTNRSTPSTAPRTGASSTRVAPPPQGRTSTAPSPHPTATRSPTPTPTPTRTAPPKPNHKPVVKAPNKAYSEKQTVNLPITVTDADHDVRSVTAAGLPSWLKLVNRHLRGTIPITAANGTTDRRHGLVSKSFRITIKATDSHQASTRRTITLKVKDTYRTMPNYIGKPGNGNDGRPAPAAISMVTRSCAYQPKGNGKHIYWQSVRPRAVIRWGARITYLYGKNNTSCRHVSGHWPH